jgi:phage terminase large subunit-like protein
MRSLQDKWVKTKSDEAALDAGCYFDITHAERVREFIGTFCKLSIDEWAGKPFQFLPFQWEEIVVPLYAWRRPDGTRRFTQASIWMPKSNGKSCLCAALSLYELIGSQTPSANIVVVATTISQAKIIYKYTTDMVAQDECLQDALWCRDNINTIEYDATRSTYRVMSGEKGGKHGHPISLLLFDELAEQDNRQLFEALRYNVNKRRNSLCINISTAGFRRESIGYEEFQRAERILSNEIVDTSTLPVVYAAKGDDDWKSLDVAKRVNPAWGITVFPDKVQEELNQAIHEPRKEAAYRTLRLNQFCGIATGWINSQLWSECGAAFNEEDLHGLDSWVGYDIGFKGDLSAYVVCVPKDDKVYLIPRFFCPELGAERKERQDKVPYQQWSKTPKYNFTLTPGEVIDPIFVREKMREDSRLFNFVEVAYDPTRGYDEFRQICEREYGWTMVAVPQRAKYLGAACAWLERAVLSKSLRHPNNPALNWNLENVAIKETADGPYPYKGAGETQRIDGVLAALMGISRYLVKDVFTASVYENAGVTL